MALTPDAIVKCFHHLGYPNVGEISTFAFGVPAAMQTTFMIGGALVRILPNAESMVYDFIAKLDRAECAVDEFLETVSIAKAEDVEYRENAFAKIAQVYKMRQQALANLLGIVPNPFDQREWLQGGTISVPVTG